MITVDEKVLQQALEALEAGPDVDPIFAGETEVALRAALEQPEQDTDCHAQGICQRSGYGIGQPEQVVPYAVWRQGFDAVRKYKEQPEPEAVATVKVMGSYNGVPALGCLIDASATHVKRGDKLYTHPPRREWRGLTEEEFGYIYVRSATHEEFARAVEQALKEKNHG
jgi:hypothetical protein